MEAAMNESSHGEEQSDAAIQLEFQMDCRGRPARGLLRDDRMGENQWLPEHDDVGGVLAAPRLFACTELRG